MSDTDLAIDARAADLGHGLLVRRLLPYAKRRMVGPFIFLDHAGPVTFAPGTARRADVRPHPHIGLATVSYLLDGAITHRDSLGYTQVITPGDVNWMTAGRGIVHSERFEDAALLARTGLELLQSWVALPDGDEEIAPAFDHYAGATLPTTEASGVWLRVIAGHAYGLASPVRTRSPLFYVHVQMETGATLDVPASLGERAIYVPRGSLEVDGVTLEPGRMLVLADGRDATLRAGAPVTVMLMGGEPLGERHIWWNFVSSRRERIEQAKADWQAGRFGLPPNDHDEFIPLPAGAFG